MDVKEVAEQAIGLVTRRKEVLKPVERMMLEGFFTGVAEGTITIGQSWIAHILCDKESLLPTMAEEKDLQIVKNIFASGMACEGQSLNGKAQTRSFSDRV